MLPVQLYPAEFITMISFLGKVTYPQLDVPIRQQPVSIAVLMGYQSRLNMASVFAWKGRDSRRMYRHNMPPAVVVALYHELTSHELNADQQCVLNRIDEALVNYRLPMPDRLALTTNMLNAAYA